MKKEKIERLTKSFYANTAREWKRLTKDPYHKLELDTTLHFFKNIFLQQD